MPAIGIIPWKNVTDGDENKATDSDAVGKKLRYDDDDDDDDKRPLLLSR